MDDAALVKDLVAWFRREARDLPFRGTRDPYRIWVSEIILQQTRVDQGIEHYARFLTAFPTVEALADATVDEVLKVWEGFGYYARARNLHKAAQVIVTGLGGRLPGCASEWRVLPGVGRYTAGAISSIAFGEQVAAVDGNCRRVLARLFNVRVCIDDAKAQNRLEVLADRLVPARRPGDFNQAVMDLGARICVPGRPRCVECPVQKHCRAYAAGSQLRTPVRKQKLERPHYEEVVAVVSRRGQYLLGKRPVGGLLGGLWEFPSARIAPDETHEQALARLAEDSFGIRITVDEQIVTVTHGYSHFTVTLYVYACRFKAGKAVAPGYDNIEWASVEDFSRFAFPKSNRKFLSCLTD